MIIKKLIGCARCGHNHKNLEFTKFLKPVLFWASDGDSGLNEEIIYTHFCPCPRSNQPILLKIIE